MKDGVETLMGYGKIEYPVTNELFITYLYCICEL